MPGIQRVMSELSWSIALGASETAEMYVAPYALFKVYVPSGVQGTHLQVLGVPTTGGDEVASTDEYAALKIVEFTAGAEVDLPACVATEHRIKLATCSDSSGTRQTQSAARSGGILYCKG